MRNKGSVGFSMVELMCVVTIIGVLASIAMSTLMDFKIRAARTEAYMIGGFARSLVAAWISNNEGVAFVDQNLSDPDVNGCIGEFGTLIGFKTTDCAKMRYRYAFTNTITVGLWAIRTSSYDPNFPCKSHPTPNRPTDYVSLHSCNVNCVSLDAIKSGCLDNISASAMHDMTCWIPSSACGSSP